MATSVTPHQINYGRRILPIKRLELFSPGEWEEFVEEWLIVKKTEYLDTDRFGGAGDKGRDVVGYVSDKKDPAYVWDCFQCKHYNDPLTPTQVYKEIAKIIYYTYLKEYPIPRRYYFVAPKGCGTSLSKLLQDAVSLKKALQENWKEYCAKYITDKMDIKLEGNLLKHFDDFDFSIFDKIPPKKVIDEHTKHPNHITIFGGGLPEREILKESDIPANIQSVESVYISQLLSAYSSESSEKFINFESLPNGSVYQKHFIRTRLNFHHAEQLRNFSRDNLPVGVFEELQEQFLDSLSNIIDEEFENGFKKIKEAENYAGNLNINSSPLSEVTKVKDKHGICHQLTNDGKIVWTQS